MAPVCEVIRPEADLPMAYAILYSVTYWVQLQRKAKPAGYKGTNRVKERDVGFRVAEGRRKRRPTSGIPKLSILTEKGHMREPRRVVTSGQTMTNKPDPVDPYSSGNAFLFPGCKSYGFFTGRGLFYFSHSEVNIATQMVCKAVVVSVLAGVQPPEDVLSGDATNLLLWVWSDSARIFLDGLEQALLEALAQEIRQAEPPLMGKDILFKSGIKIDWKWISTFLIKELQRKGLRHEVRALELASGVKYGEIRARFGDHGCTFEGRLSHLRDVMRRKAFSAKEECFPVPTVQLRRPVTGHGGN